MDTKQCFEPGEPWCSDGMRGSGGLSTALSTALTEGISRHSEAASRFRHPRLPLAENSPEFQRLPVIYCCGTIAQRGWRMERAVSVGRPWVCVLP